MRLSRPRVILRAALLVGGGLFMLWRARATRDGAGGLGGDEALLLSRVALAEALVGGLALAAAALALLALRARRPSHTLKLSDLEPGKRAGGEPGEG